jgi:hypothetical protein
MSVGSFDIQFPRPHPFFDVELFLNLFIWFHFLAFQFLIFFSLSLDTAKFELVDGHAISHDSVRYRKEQLFLFNFQILWRIWNWRGIELLPFEWLDYYIVCAAASL